MRKLLLQRLRPVLKKAVLSTNPDWYFFSILTFFKLKEIFLGAKTTVK